jgi:hypothetical protein
MGAVAGWLQVWSDRAGLWQWQISDRKGAMRRVGRVSKIVCMRVLCSSFSPSLLSAAPVARRNPDLQKVDRSVCPVASSQAINEATHIEWLHKKGIVEGLSLSSSDRESVQQAARRFRPKSLVA